MKYGFVKERKNVLIQIKGVISEFKKQIIGLFFIQCLFLIGTIGTPYLYGLLVDEVMINKRINLLLWICVGYVTIYVIDSILVIVQRKIQVRTFNFMKLKIRNLVWEKYLKAPYKFHEDNGKGDLKQIMDTDVDAFESFINEQLISYVYNWISLIVYFCIIVCISWKLAIFSFLMVPIAFWMTKRMAKGSGEAWGAYRYDYGHYESWLHGSISNWKEIKVLNQQNNQLEKLESEWGKLRSNFYKGCLYFFINRSFIGFSDFFITKMNLYFVGGILIFNGYLKIGLLFVFIKYYEKFFACVNGLTHADMRIVEYMPKVNRVLEILRMRIKDEHRGKSISETDIQFKNVCFRYEGGDKNVINNLNLSVANKQCISLVGDSGNGKTTLIKLLLGLYDEYSGEILIGDTELREISVDELHTKVAVVMQDSILFNDTIINNMKIVKPDATQSEIMDACKKANIHKEISEMAEGYYTIIGEKGIQLSGGQKQRLAIARALLMKPKIIVFDEATSALDSESEQAINKTIRALKGTTTVLIIAHRLSSIIISDKIAVLKDSRIVEQGEFSELSRNGKEFKELFAGQMQLM